MIYINLFFLFNFACFSIIVSSFESANYLLQLRKPYYSNLVSIFESADCLLQLRKPYYSNLVKFQKMSFEKKSYKNAFCLLMTSLVNSSLYFLPSCRFLQKKIYILNIMFTFFIASVCFFPIYFYNRELGSLDQKIEYEKYYLDKSLCISEYSVGEIWKWLMNTL